jgi:hypothetical protein
MAVPNELKKIALTRLKTAKILIDASDWDGAAYMLGYALECALKAAICKSLRLTAYPDTVKDGPIRTFFATHKFDQLLVVSGLQDIFNAAGNVDCFRHWSEFTVEYPGDWPSMRYNLGRMNQFDEKKARALHANLTDPQHGVLTTIKRKRRW